MSATVYRDTIYISKNLLGTLTPKERKVLLAHEIAHHKGKDRVKIVALMIAMLGATTACMFTGNLIAGALLMCLFVPILRFYQRHIEIEADKYALECTKDFDSFISLMDKLEHNGSTHPGKAERIRLAQDMREKYV